MTQADWALSIDGLPYYAATRGAGTIVSWYPADDEPRGAVQVVDALAEPLLSWTERVTPTEGRLEVTALTFRLHDVTAGGVPWLTSLATREATSVPSAVLATSVTATGTTFELTASSVGAVSSAIPGVLWVDGEAINCASIASTTVTVATGGRGYYGTRPKAHVVDEELGVWPEAWVLPPWSVRRRTILWRVDENGAATAVWRGYSNRAPRLHADRASYEYQCEHAWTVERARALGDATAGTRVRGYNAAGVVVSVADTVAGWTGAGTMTSWTPRDGYGIVHDGPDALLSAIRANLRDTISSYSAGAFRARNVAIATERRGAAVTLRLYLETTESSRNLSLSALVMGEGTTSVAVSQATVQFGYWTAPTGQYTELALTLPEVAVVIASEAYGRGQRVPVTSTEGLPSSAVPLESILDGPHSTTIQQALVGDYDDDLRFAVLQPAISRDDAAGSYGTATGGSSTTLVDTGAAWVADEWAGLTVRIVSGTGAGQRAVVLTNDATSLTIDSTWTAPDATSRYAIQGAIRGPAARGTCVFLDKTTGRPRPPVQGVRGLTGTSGNPFGANVTLLDRRVELLLSAIVRTTHWAYGMRAVIDSSLVAGDIDPRNFVWTTLPDTVAYVEGDAADRLWYVDGTKTLSDLTEHTMIAEGVVPTVRDGGRVTLAPVRWPTPTETPTAVYSAADLVAGTGVEWQAVPESVTNVARLKTSSYELVVRDARSVGRYGAARPIDIELDGLRPGSLLATDPRVAGARLLSRLVQIWGDPIALVRWVVPSVLADQVYPGAIVELSDDVAPDGLGARGLDARRLWVVSRAVDLRSHRTTLEALAMPVAYAYGPAVRVASISGAVVTAASGYVLAGSLNATDYAGLGGTDRGVSRFVPGDEVMLVLRDVTSVGELAATVASVNAGAGTITLTASVSTSPTDWPALAASGIVDLVYAPYTTVAPEQQGYAVVGGGSAEYGDIDSTGDATRRWAP